MLDLNDELIVIIGAVAKDKKSYRQTAIIIGKSLAWVQIQIKKLDEAGYIKQQDKGGLWSLTAKGRKVMEKNGL